MPRWCHCHCPPHDGHGPGRARPGPFNDPSGSPGAAPGESPATRLWQFRHYQRAAGCAATSKPRPCRTVGDPPAGEPPRARPEREAGNERGSVTVAEAEPGTEDPAGGSRGTSDQAGRKRWPGCHHRHRDGCRTLVERARPVVARPGQVWARRGGHHRWRRTASLPCAWVLGCPERWPAFATHPSLLHLSTPRRC